MKKIFFIIVSVFLFSNSYLFAQIDDPIPSDPCDDGFWIGFLSDPANKSNVAVSGQATQSSYRLTGGEPSLAIDDNKFGNSSLTSFETDPWWEAELGQKSMIDEMEIWYDSNLFPNGIEGAYILFSEYPFGSTELNSSLASPYVQHIYLNGQIPNGYNFSFDPIRTKHIRIQ